MIRRGMANVQKIFTIAAKAPKEFPNTPTKMRRSLHNSLKWPIGIAQCFGLMPIIGITNQDYRFLKFRWKSLRTVYSILNCIGSAFISSFYVYRIVQGNADIFEYNSLMFNLNAFIVSLSFIQLAREWPRLMRKWSAVEYSMRSYGWPKHLHLRLNILTAVFLVIAAVEYVMTKTDGLVKAARCKPEDMELFEYHFRYQLYKEIFGVIDYAAWKGVLLQFENILTTFAWSFNDIFVMLISTALALRFKQITTRLLSLKLSSKDDVKEDIWREIREDYDKLSRLTKTVDASISYIILTSFASNLFFILMQLFHSIRKLNDSLEKVYFFFSFAFLILRTVCVSLYGAWIHDESKEPLVTLNSVPSNIYNPEIKRFIEQIKFDTVALSGKNFFYVTRGLVLSMAGAIVTYELVLIQFNEDLLKKSDENSTLC